jgi:hypothetical protein
MKTTNLFVAIVAALAATTVSVFGKDPISIDVESKAVQAYVDDDGLNFYHGTALQSSVTFSNLPGGLSFNVWQHRGLAGKGEPGDIRNETDYLLSLDHPVGKFTATIGVGYYDLDTFFKSARNNISLFYARLQGEEENGATFVPFLELKAYRTRPDADYEGGTRLTAGLQFKSSLGSATVEHSASLTREDGAWGYGKALVGKYSADVVWGSDKLSLVLPSITVFHPFVKNDGQKTKLVLAAALRKTW